MSADVEHAGGNGKQIFGDTWWLEPEQVTPYDASLLAACPA